MLYESLAKNIRNRTVFLTFSSTYPRHWTHTQKRKTEMECKDKDFLISQYIYLAEEIRFSKRQQIMVTWYILLLFGAIVKTYKSWWPGTYWTAIIASIILLGIGLAYIYSCNKSQNNNNERIKNVRKKFGLNCEMTEKTYSDPYCLYYSIHIFSWIVTILIVVN